MFTRHTIYKTSTRQLIGLVTITATMLFTLNRVSYADSFSGPVSPYYINQAAYDNNGHIYVVQGTKVINSFSTTYATSGGAGYQEGNLAVTNVISTTGFGSAYGFPNTAGQYTLSGTPTGVSYTLQPTPGFEIYKVETYYDGTSDGAHNYTVQFYGLDNSNIYQENIIQTDLNWQNPIVLFSVQVSPISQLDWQGITYDPTNNSLWLSHINGGGYISNYSLDGTLLSSFSTGNQIRALALDHQDNTLWGSVEATNLLVQYAKDGTLLQIGVPDGLPVNGTVNGYYAGEFAATHTHIPSADAGQNLTITSENQSNTVLHGTATDPDNGPLSYRWLEGQVVLLDSTPVEANGEANLNLGALLLPLTVGTHTLTLEVSDGKATVTDEMILTIGNSAPHAAPTGGGDYAPNNEIKLGGQVSDFDGDWLTYIWSEGLTEYYRGQIQAVIGGVPVDLPDHKLYMGLGTHTVTLTVDDGTNLPVSSNIIINVIDSSKPTLSPEPDKSILWPPNHKMVNISINANASDDSGFVTLSATVASNEPQDGLGDGDMDPDWTEPVINQQTGVITIQLRAERSGSGNGREYTVFITAKDASNNISTVPVKILVPHDKGK